MMQTMLIYKNVGIYNPLHSPNIRHLLFFFRILPLGVSGDVSLQPGRVKPAVPVGRGLIACMRPIVLCIQLLYSRTSSTQKRIWTT